MNDYSRKPVIAMADVFPGSEMSFRPEQGQDVKTGKELSTNPADQSGKGQQ